jgi:putative transcriptional regulator
LEVELARTAFEKIAQGLNDARSHAHGTQVKGMRAHKINVQRTEIAGLRMREGLTQTQFAELLGTSLGTLRKWESGERTPSGAAARLMTLFAAKPKLVTQTLGIRPTTAKRRARSGLAAGE